MQRITRGNKKTSEKAFLLRVIILGLLLLVALPAWADDIFVVNAISRTISRYNIESGYIDNSFAATGLYPNKMLLYENYLYLTNSGDNNVQKIDKSTGETLTYIDLEDDSNPYDMVIAGDYLYVTGLLSNKVYKINLSTDEVVDEVKVGTAPQGAIIHGERLYAANSGFVYPGYIQGEISVIDLGDFSKAESIPVHFNPQRMAIDENDLLHLVCTGDYEDNTGKIMIIDTHDHRIIDKVDFGNYPMNIAVPHNGRVYVGDAFNAGVFTYDADSFQIVHDYGDPFAGGGGALFHNEDYLIIGDAKDFTSNSRVDVYDLDERHLFSFEAAVGVVDIAMGSLSTNVDDYVISPQIDIYPNPSSANFKIDIKHPQGIPYAVNIDSHHFEIAVYNIKGQLIDRLNTASNTIVWNGTDASGNPGPSGIYLMRVKDSRKQVIASQVISLIR